MIKQLSLKTTGANIQICINCICIYITTTSNIDYFTFEIKIKDKFPHKWVKFNSTDVKKINYDLKTQNSNSNIYDNFETYKKTVLKGF
jgi:hypothetical protein